MHLPTAHRKVQHRIHSLHLSAGKKVKWDRILIIIGAKQAITAPRQILRLSEHRPEQQAKP